MNNYQERQRLNELFADLERLAVNPAGNTPEILHELESLRARIVELEKHLPECENNAVDSENDPVAIPQIKQPRSEHRILYEKDQIGYGFSNDKLESLQDSTHKLPDINNVNTSLLTVSGQTIGEMQIEPAPERPLTQDDMDLANVIAQQAALQIQNLRLLTAAERSRAEAESATRRFMHEGWDTYLDAIHRNERIGFTYDQSSLAPYSDALHVNGGVHAPVKVMEEQVGALYVEPGPTHPLTAV